MIRKEFQGIGLGSPCTLEHKRAVEKRYSVVKQNLEFNNPMRILDAGCGNGIHLERLSRDVSEPSELIGIDVIGEHPIAAKDTNRGNVSSIMNSAEDLAFTPDTFDAIVSIETLEHVIHDEKAIKEFSRVIRRGGMLIVTAPNRLFPFLTHVVDLRHKQTGGVGLIRRCRFIPARFRRATHRARDYTPRGLESILTRNGFRIRQLDFLMPQFEGIGNDAPRYVLPIRLLRKACNLVEHIPFLKRFGMTIVVCCQKE